MHSHKARLKQKNKKHKGSTSKRERFKTGDATKRTGPKSRDKQAAAGKEDRFNRAKQILKDKRAAQWLKSRIGSSQGPPKVVALVGLSGLADPDAVLQKLLGAADTVHEAPVTAQAGGGGGGGGGGCRLVTAEFKQHGRQRLTFAAGLADAGAAADAAKLADILMLVLPMQNGIDSAVDHAGELALSLVKSQGTPSVVGVVQGLDMLNSKKAAEAKKIGLRFFQTEFGDSHKTADAQNQVQLLRALTTAAPRAAGWRAARAHVLAEGLEFRPGGGNGAGVLRVTGHVRGRPLDAGRLVHLPGLPGARRLARALRAHDGDEEILATPDPAKQESLEMEAVPDALAGEQTWPTEEELAMADEGGDAAAAGKGGGGAAAAAATRRRAKSGIADDITAAWADALGEDFEGGGSDDEEGMDEDGDGGSGAGVATAGGDEEEEGMEEDVAVTEDELRCARLAGREREDKRFPDEVDTPLDRPARERFARYRALKSFRTSYWDPMENLPRDYGRVFRFDDFPLVQKRLLGQEAEATKAQDKAALASRAASRAASVAAARSRSATRSRAASLAAAAEGGGDADDDDDATMAAAAEEEEGVGGGGGIDDGMAMDTGGGGGSMAPPPPPAAAGACGAPPGGGPGGPLAAGGGRVASGQRVVLEVEGVTAAEARHLAALARRSPLAVFSLLEMENKLSVLHFLIQKHPSCEEAIPSKEELIFRTGFRSWAGRPIFSQNSLQSDKHKYERFLPGGGAFSVASVYGPVTFQPCPVAVYKRKPDGDLALVATGGLQSVDPNRLCVKRVVLTGYPVKVKKRTATVKYMFFNPEDVRWFKPAELVTKHGLTGHIKEPLGTHGLFKIYVNKPIKQHDTVCLNLYKRIYPKFPKDTEKVITF